VERVYVLALEVAGFAEAFAERRAKGRASDDPALTNPTIGIAGCWAPPPSATPPPRRPAALQSLAASR